ncbi:MAG: hypothetical protein NC096_02300 [Candidatus Amulumruptor caecigallinarius]|nr:hypothetical protein [Candidatus Amulumruptor caecigallinarius]
MNNFFPLILYILLSILVIVITIFVIRLFKTLNKVDKVIDDLNFKLEKVNGVFEIVDKSTSFIDSIGNKITDMIMGLISKISRGKKRKENDYE